MPKKVYSFRASEETERYLKYLIQKHNPCMTISLCDAITWYALKIMVDESKQLQLF